MSSFSLNPSDESLENLTIAWSPFDSRCYVGQNDHQDGGHIGCTYLSKDGKQLIKRTGEDEINFYESLINGTLEKDYPGFNLLKKFIPTYYGVVDTSWLSTDGISLATAESQEKVPIYGEDGKIIGYKQNNADKYKMCIVLDHLGRGVDVEMSADFKAGTRLSGSRAAKSNPIKYKQQRINAQDSTSSKYGLRFAGAEITRRDMKIRLKCSKNRGHTHSLDDNINAVFPSVFDRLPPGSEHYYSKAMSSTCSDAFGHLYKIEKDTLDSVLEIRKQVEELAMAVEATKWDFAGSSILFFVGRDKSGMMKTRVGFIDFTHAESHESELGPDGIQKGFKTLDRLLKKRASELEASLACLDCEK
ncbi:uncharacterized protein L203_101023 [Cryptococcus depauperatus CBS 7841]|uniref:Kinase n=1 Tax=Cryptococcus depauperatus CBS 7841 TaxID=1295531 RepID=A0A1E3IKI1_9TREE|nr:hypothetical protein L203_02514 [Cryptococcus depauperatus CBS 7841]